MIINIKSINIYQKFFYHYNKVCKFDCSWYKDNDDIYYYHISLCVGKNRRQCNDWINGKIKKKTKRLDGKTYKIGIYFLIQAYRELKRLEQKLMKYHNIYQDMCILINCFDDRRFFAFRYLERDGYVITKITGEDFYSYIKVIEYEKCVEKREKYLSKIMK